MPNFIAGHMKQYKVVYFDCCRKFLDNQVTLITRIYRGLWNGYCYPSHVRNLWL